MGPPTDVRIALAEARAAGVSFDDAWSNATRSLPGGYTTTNSWAYVLEETRGAWRDAYERRPARVDARRVENLHDLWLAA
jgi:hypothetical protein